eukprot:1727944-Amphidinium_carterae.2
MIYEAYVRRLGDLPPSKALDLAISLRVQNGPVMMHHEQHLSSALSSQRGSQKPEATQWPRPEVLHDPQIFTLQPPESWRGGAQHSRLLADQSEVNAKQRDTMMVERATIPLVALLIQMCSKASSLNLKGAPNSNRSVTTCIAHASFS